VSASGTCRSADGNACRVARVRTTSGFLENMHRSTPATLRLFSCRVIVATEHEPAGRFTRARTSWMSVARDGLDIEGQPIRLTDVRRVSCRRGWIRLSSSQGLSEIGILSPLTGTRDPSLARLVEKLINALLANDMPRAERASKELRVFSRLTLFAMAASVCAVLAAGVLAFVFPSLLLAFALTPVLFCISVAWLPTLYASWVGRLANSCPRA